MAGTKEGGRKAAATNKATHGEDFYARIGSKGGTNGRTGGFASTRYTPCNCDVYPETHTKVQCAGRKGGTISRRRKPEEDQNG